MPDLSIIFYTANVIPEKFAKVIRTQILKVGGEYPIISVSFKPLDFGQNILVDLPRHHLSIYKQALLGAKEAKTEYIALAEDDVLYSPEHFKHRPKPGKFAYNLGTWNMFTWGEPIFNHKERRNMGQLICERKLFIEALEERFRRWPVDSDINLGKWAEPTKYENHLDVTVRDPEFFYSNPPNIIFSHQTALSYENLGDRKKMGELRVDSIPYWGSAKHIRSIYE